MLASVVIVAVLLLVRGRFPRVLARATGQGEAAHQISAREDAPATTDFLRRVFPVGTYHDSLFAIFIGWLRTSGCWGW
ncbi:hypothetical protein B0T14DRAFT_517592 [Immersiella caudata]|uniref:Uncharacterized protein n=1 Tax=Immersiella caudata TaxID=314043 RepID=A0AA39WYU8_9PEZI|nr:hypothetical protein B0T14DRAFT_517592 [Immersiella caudata]